MLSFLVALFCFFFAVQASPLSLVSRAANDVFVPKIISPNSTTVWVTGQTESVEWMTSDAPKDISNGAAVLLSDYNTPLALHFDLRAGHVDVLVPDVPRGFYYITLFGDSGDYSERFWIDGPSPLAGLVKA